MSSPTAVKAERALISELGAGLGVAELLCGLDDPGKQLPCRQGNGDLFFAESPAELERAKALCADCPVRSACLAGAQERQEPWGVWGGEIFERGSIVARKRPRGRPRKNSTAAAAAVPAQGRRS